MNDFILNNLDWIAGGVGCVLFFMLGIFISTVSAEKRHYKLQERKAREEAAELKKSEQRSRESAEEFVRLRTEATEHREALRQKDQEIQELRSQLEGAAEEHRKLEEQLRKADAEQGGLENRVKSEVSGMQQELIKLREERQGMAEKVASAEKVLSDVSHFEDAVHAQVDQFHDIEQRIQDVRAKVEALTAKANGGTENHAAATDVNEVDLLRQAMKTEEPPPKDEGIQKPVDEKKDPA